MFLLLLFFFSIPISAQQLTQEVDNTETLYRNAIQQLNQSSTHPQEENEAGVVLMFQKMLEIFGIAETGKHEIGQEISAAVGMLKHAAAQGHLDARMVLAHALMVTQKSQIENANRAVLRG